jgi:hypothetical protein
MYCAVVLKDVTSFDRKISDSRAFAAVYENTSALKYTSRSGGSWVETRGTEYVANIAVNSGPIEKLTCVAPAKRGLHLRNVQMTFGEGLIRIIPNTSPTEATR